MADDDAEEPAKPSRWRQIKALMKIRFLTDHRSPFVWFMRIGVPVLLVLFSAWRSAVPTGWSTFSRFELKPEYYVNVTPGDQSSGNPGLAVWSSASSGLLLTQFKCTRISSVATSW